MLMREVIPKDECGEKRNYGVAKKKRKYTASLAAVPAHSSVCGG